jgi:predicted sulfurtransferase
MEETTKPSTDCDSMIALFYWYVQIPQNSLEKHLGFHKYICCNLDLFGRIRISESGLNGVLSGKKCDLEYYECKLREEVMTIQQQEEQCDSGNKIFQEPQKEARYGETLDVKYCQLRDDIPLEKQMFKSLSIKITKEVVSLNEWIELSSRLRRFTRIK